MQYPIGKFKAKSSYSLEEAKGNLEIIRAFPSNLKAIQDQLTAPVLATTYREDGWNAQQVVHHIADSHGNMLIRLKWTLTEDCPKIKAYEEVEWAKLPDYNLPISLSINMIEIIHAKACAIFDALDNEDLEQYYLHPEDGKAYQLKKVLALYAWHGSHHLEHLKICIKNA